MQFKASQKMSNPDKHYLFKYAMPEEKKNKNEGPSRNYHVGNNSRFVDVNHSKSISLRNHL